MESTNRRKILILLQYGDVNKINKLVFFEVEHNLLFDEFWPRIFTV